MVARTAAGAALTRAHQRQQLALRAATLRDLALLWPTWETGNISEFGAFIQLAEVLLNARHQDSAGLAARYFGAFRQAEGIGGAAVPKLAARLPLLDIAANLRATALAGTLRALRAGFSSQAASRAGFVQAAGSAGRMVMMGGRDTIVNSVKADRRAEAWIRVPSGSPCAFCRTLAGRGPEYKSERSASFKAHDHCACGAEPFYAGSKVPAANERYEREYVAAQRWARDNPDAAPSGTSNDALNNYRAYLAAQAGE